MSATTSVREVAVQQQHLHQHPDAGGIAERFASRGPERLMRWREHARSSCLSERGGAGQRSGLAQQDLQVVVQVEDLHALPDRALMPRHYGGADEDGHR
jgi:hypothetical protein